MTDGLMQNQLSWLRSLEKFYQKMKLNLPEMKVKLERKIDILAKPLHVSLQRKAMDASKLAKAW